MTALLRALWILSCLACVLGPPCGVRADSPTALRRFALLVGSNRGGATRAPLRYAVSDADALGRVLGELGGVAQGDAQLLREPDPRALERALSSQAEAIERIRGAQRSEFVFYYSGHSDDQGLRLGDALVPYATLRTWLERVRADVRIVVLDSCASGSFTRKKGGVQVLPFLFDASIDVRGQAVLTASAESEAAQESDRIGGSFFTHYLVSGLRGAADTSGDGQVTLTEAYRYAFDETLARTGVTEHGAQHPSYDIRLSGTGDLVFTDLRSARARLKIGADVEGRLFVRDASLRLLAEVRKERGKASILSLPEGDYTLWLDSPKLRARAQATIRASSPFTVTSQSFTPVTTEIAFARGDLPEPTLVPVGFAAFSPYDTYDHAGTRSYLALHLAHGELDVLRGFALSLGATTISRRADGVLLALAVNRVHTLHGVAIAPLANVSDGIHQGLSVSAFLQLSRGELRGLSLGPLQVAHRTLGMQLGAVNWSRESRGVQLGGLNMVASMHGMQVGLVNVARGPVRGVQLGLVNYAQSVDVGLSPFSITRDGGVHAQLLGGSLAFAQLSLRFDARYTYSFFGTGWHPFGDEQSRTYLFGGGFGAKIPVASRLSVELDLGSYLVQPLLRWRREVPTLESEARALLRVEFVKHLSLVAGISFGFLVNRQEDSLFPGSTRHFYRIDTRDADLTLHYGPGWVTGIRF